MISRGKLVFITGAARSGKSSFAERMAAETGSPVIYIATCVPGDEEMLERVARHQARRPANWRTVEEPLDPASVIKENDSPGKVFLLDCITLLVLNLILDPKSGLAEDELLEKMAELAQVSYYSAADVIMVSNEVGWGIVPGDPLSRMYRDVIGRANQAFAAQADEAWFTVSGIPLELKSLAKGT
jgi:adenosylcobinamide kinase/adenosylcobinamide-phosphate guanylyltransferase